MINYIYALLMLLVVSSQTSSLNKDLPEIKACSFKKSIPSISPEQWQGPVKLVGSKPQYCFGVKIVDLNLSFDSKRKEDYSMHVNYAFANMSAQKRSGTVTFWLEKKGNRKEL